MSLRCLAHLIKVCHAEQIDAEEAALSLIIKETGGSIRDALNLLEQVRFSDARVTKETVHRVLGHLDDTRLLQLFEIVLYKSPAQFLAFAQQESLESFSAEFLWQRMTDLIRASIWIKNGVTPRQFGDYAAQLQFLTRGKTLKYMTALLELFYSNEPLFRKTTAQYAFLEVLLLRICQKNESNSNSSMPAAAAQSVSSDGAELSALEEDENESEETQDPEPSYDDENAAMWARLVAQVDILHDPLLSSIFKQGALLSYDKEKKLLTVDFPKQLTFFSDIIETTASQWKPLFAQMLGHPMELVSQFTQVKATAEPVVAVAQKITKPVITVAPAAKPVEKFKTQYQPYGQRTMRSAPVMLNEPKVDVSDSSLWPHVNTLLLHFPGTVTQIRELV